jgi:hypothetical protein
MPSPNRQNTRITVNCRKTSTCYRKKNAGTYQEGGSGAVTNLKTAAQYE